MRILYVNDYADLSGGAELQLENLRRGIEGKGATTHFFGTAVPIGEPPSYADGTQTQGFTGRMQVATSAFNPFALQDLRRVLASFEPDLVHIRMFLWQLSPAILLPLRHIPVIYQPAVYKAICPNGRKVLPDGRQCKFQPGKICRR
ncbi:MAG: glycosyltransferase, partial [Parvularcula sp.]|nr:glycosyltransferase [Parvularcula sp.]